MYTMTTQIAIIRYIGALFHSYYRRLIMCISTCVIIILSLCSCKYQTDIEALRVIAEYEMPFVDVDSRWSKAELIETDNYGRMLYSVCSINDENNNVFSDYVIDDVSNSPVLAYVVCQKTDDNNVYFYKSDCFRFVSSLSTENSVIRNLKELNDWNTPIDEKKLIKRSTDLNGIEDYKLYQTEEKAIADLEIVTGNQIDDYYIDVIFSAHKQPVYIVRTVERWSEKGIPIQFGESYAFCYSNNCSEVSYVMLTQNIGTWNEQVNMTG